MPAATAAALPPDEPPGTRVVSQGLRVGPKAEFSVEEPIANSSRLVLPTSDRAGAAEPAHDRRVVGRQPALEDPRRARRRDPLGAEVVLQGDRHAGERAGVAARAAPVRSTASAAAMASLGRHVVEAVQVALELIDALRAPSRGPTGR